MKESTISDDVPMIHTCRGHIPQKDLDYKVSWDVTYENGIPKSIAWIGEHFYEGESVRREVHICVLQGPSLVSETESKVN